MERENAVGCLIIDDFRSGGDGLSGLCFAAGLRPYPFDWDGEERPLPALQGLLQQARRECGAAAILARGRGCGAALALAEQLPVERLALIEPERALRGGLARRAPLERLNAFARRNLSLCVSDALVIEHEDSRGCKRLRDGGFCAHARLARLTYGGERDKELYTICENTTKTAVTHFLRAGECPKELAENPEMCIIDG